LRVIGFDKKIYNINFSKSAHKSFRENKSAYHNKARKLISEIFPFEVVYEETTLPGSRTRATGLLYADFIIPKLSIIIEVHGEQHYKFSKFFHKTKKGFQEHKRRDFKKTEWCLLNDITMIVLPFDKEEEWESLLKNWK
jgi:very-short-patch-repair endonuclease